MSQQRNRGVVVMVVQQVLFELESSYLGHSYFVTGHALFNALARRVDERVRRGLRVSHGVFVPGEYGEYPAGASQEGYAGKLGQSLPEVESYEDLFVFRDSAHRWLLSSRPRDAHNVLDVQRHGERVAFAPECWFGRPPEQRNSKRSMLWYVNCYLSVDDCTEDVLPLSEDVLDGLRVGGARNYGFGELSMADSQVVDVEALDFSRVRAASDLRVELVTPFVLQSEHPSGDVQSVPWWWGVDGELRRRVTQLADGADVFEVATIDHGQVVAYTGSEPVRTARNGVRRVGTHSRFGFGELRLRPAGESRVLGLPGSGDLPGESES